MSQHGNVKCSIVREDKKKENTEKIKIYDVYDSQNDTQRHLLLSFLWAN